MPKSVRGVMQEFGARKLHSGSPTGPVVTNRRQALAIAMSEQRQQKRALHPALAARAVAIKAAHAHLSATVPGFRSHPPAVQFAHTQRHIRTKLTRKG